MEDSQFYEWTEYEIRLIDIQKLLIDNNNSPAMLLEKNYLQFTKLWLQIESFLPQRMESLITKRAVRIFQVFFFKLVDSYKNHPLQEESVRRQAPSPSVETLQIEELRPKFSNQQCTFLQQTVYDQFEEIEQTYSSPATRSLPLTYQEQQEVRMQLETRIKTFNVEATIIELQQIHTNFQASKNEMMMFLNNIQRHVRKVRKIEVEHNINGQLEIMKEEKELIMVDYEKKLFDLVKRVKKEMMGSQAIIDGLRRELKAMNPDKMHCFTQTSNTYVHDLKRRQQDVMVETERLKKLIEHYDKMNKAIKYQIQENKIPYVEERNEQVRNRKNAGGKLTEIKEEELGSLNLSNLVENIQQLQSFVGKEPIKKMSKYAKEVVTNTLDSLIKNINEGEKEKHKEPTGKFSWPREGTEVSIDDSKELKRESVYDIYRGSEEDSKSPSETQGKIVVTAFETVSPKKVSRRETLFSKKVAMLTSIMALNKGGESKNENGEKGEKSEKGNTNESQVLKSMEENVSELVDDQGKKKEQSPFRQREQQVDSQHNISHTPENTQQGTIVTANTSGDNPKDNPVHSPGNTTHLPFMKTVSTLTNNNRGNRLHDIEEKNDIQSEKDQKSERTINKPPPPRLNKLIPDNKNSLPQIESKSKGALKKVGSTSSRQSINKRESQHQVLNKLPSKQVQKSQKVQEVVAPSKNIMRHSRQHSYQQQGYSTEYNPIGAPKQINTEEKVKQAPQVIAKETQSIEVQTDQMDTRETVPISIEEVGIQTEFYCEEPSLLLTNIYSHEAETKAEQISSEGHIEGHGNYAFTLKEMNHQTIHTSSNFNFPAHKPQRNQKRYPSMDTQNTVHKDSAFRSLEYTPSVHLTVPHPPKPHPNPTTKYYSHHHTSIDKTLITATSSPKPRDLNLQNHIQVVAKRLFFNNQNNSLDNLNIRQLACRIAQEQREKEQKRCRENDKWYYNIAKMKDRLKKLGPEYIKKRREINPSKQFSFTPILPAT